MWVGLGHGSISSPGSGLVGLGQLFGGLGWAGSMKIDPRTTLESESKAASPWWLSGPRDEPQELLKDERKVTKHVKSDQHRHYIGITEVRQ